MLRALLMLTVLSASDVTPQIEAIWKGLRPGEITGRPTSWSWRMTPAVPAEWPPKSNAAPVIRYVYAAMADPTVLRDAERTSPPFASVEIAADGTAKVSALVKELGATEPQGFKPVTKDEAERLKADLIEPARAGQMSSMRAQWCTWLRYNGVVGQHLAAKHKSFFDALECSAVKSAK